MRSSRTDRKEEESWRRRLRLSFPRPVVEATDSLVRVREPYGAADGPGVCISSDGLVIASARLIHGVSRRWAGRRGLWERREPMDLPLPNVWVTTVHNRTVKASIVGYDLASDIALLQLHPERPVTRAWETLLFRFGIAPTLHRRLWMDDAEREARNEATRALEHEFASDLSGGSSRAPSPFPLESALQLGDRRHSPSGEGSSSWRDPHWVRRFDSWMGWIKSRLTGWLGVGVSEMPPPIALPRPIPPVDPSTLSFSDTPTAAPTKAEDEDNDRAAVLYSLLLAPASLYVETAPWELDVSVGHARVVDRGFAGQMDSRRGVPNADGAAKHPRGFYAGRFFGAWTPTFHSSVSAQRDDCIPVPSDRLASIGPSYLPDASEWVIGTSELARVGGALSLWLLWPDHPVGEALRAQTFVSAGTLPPVGSGSLVASEAMRSLCAESVSASDDQLHVTTPLLGLSPARLSGSVGTAMVDEAGQLAGWVVRGCPDRWEAIDAAHVAWVVEQLRHEHDGTLGGERPGSTIVRPVWGLTSLQWSPQEHAVVVREIVRNTPAHAAGMRPGDRIVAVEGREVAGVRTVRWAEAILPRATVTVLRPRREGEGEAVATKLALLIQRGSNDG